MSFSLAHPSPMALHTLEQLRELKRKEELEQLRRHMRDANLFMPGKNPATAPIRHEELKKLCRYFKLNHQSGFWKKHPDKDSMIEALRAHIAEQEDDDASVTAPPPPPDADAHGSAGAAGADGNGVGNDAAFKTKAHRRRSGFARRHTNRHRRHGETKSTFKRYAGDHFGTNTPKSHDGMIYRSRLTVPGSTNKKGHEILKLWSAQDDEEAEDGAAGDGGEQGGHRFSAGGGVDARHGGDTQQTPEEEARLLALQCATGLYNFSHSADGEEMIVREGAVRAIVKLAAKGDEDLSAFCAATLCNLACCSASQCRAMMLEQDVLKGLSLLARAEHPGTRLHVATTFVHLCTEPEFERLLYQEARLNTIVALVNHEDERIKELAVITLCNLARGSSAIGTAPSGSHEEDRPVHDDVMPALHALSKSTNPSRPALVAEALCKLSSITMNLIKIVEGGGIPLLVTLSQSSSAVTRRHSCVALCNISYVWAKRDKIIKEGAAAALAVHAKRMSEDEPLREKIALALCNLATNRGTVDQVVHDGVVRALVDCAALKPVHYGEELHPRIANAFAMLSSTDRPYHECSACAELLKQGAVEACVNLSKVDLSLHRDASQAGSSRLVSSLANSSNQLLEQMHIDLLVTLCNLSAVGQNGAVKLVQSGVVGVLVRLVNEGSPEVRVECANTLSNLTCCHAVLQEMLEQELLQTLIALSMGDDDDEADPDSELLLTCARCFDSLSAHRSVRHRIVSDGITPAILHLAALDLSTAPPATREHCALAICNLLHEAECGGAEAGLDPVANRTQMVAEGVLPLLLEMAHETPLTAAALAAQASLGIALPSVTRPVRPRIAAALCRLSELDLRVTCGASGNDHQTDVMKVVPALIALAKSDDAEVMERCAAALFNLSSRDYFLQAMGRDPAVAPGLIRMMRSGHGETQLHAVRCLQRCTTVDTLAGLMLRPAEEDADSTKTTVRDFVVIALLLGSSLEQIKETCARCFFNLLRPVATRAQMVEPSQDVLWALIKIARDCESLAAKRICANVLYNLACDEKSVPVLMRVSVGRVMKELSNFREAEDMKILLRWKVLQSRIADGKALSKEDKKELDAHGKLRQWYDIERRHREEFEEQGLLVPKQERDAQEALKAELQAAGRFPTTNLDTTQDMLQTSLEHIEEVRKFCAAALCRLSWSHDTSTKEQMVREGAVEAAQDLSKTDDARARWNCVTVLCNLSFHRPTQLQMVRDRAVSAISTLARCRDPEVEILCARALFELSTNADCHHRFASDGGPATLCLLLDSVLPRMSARGAFPDDNSRQQAHMVAAAMYNLSCSPAESVLCAEHMVAAGALPQLVRLCAHPAQDTEGAVLAIRSIANISCTTTTRSQMVDLGVAAACVNVIDKSVCDGDGWNAEMSAAHAQRCCKRMRANSSVILCNLAATEIACAKPMANSSGPSGDDAVTVSAIQRGQADSDDDENAGELDVGAMSGGHGLEDMSDYAHATLLRRCAIILRNISCDHYCREFAIALPWLMPMFQHLTKHLQAMVRAPENFEQGQIAAHDTSVAIANLALGNEAGMAALPQCVPTLITLADLGTEQTKEMTGTTIAKLSMPEDGQSVKLEDGSTSALLALLDEHDDKNAVSMDPTDAIERVSGLGTLRNDAPSMTLEHRDEPATWELSERFEDDFPTEAVRVDELPCMPEENVAGANDEKISDWTDRMHSFGDFHDGISVPREKVHTHDGGDPSNIDSDSCRTPSPANISKVHSGSSRRGSSTSSSPFPKAHNGSSRRSSTTASSPHRPHKPTSHKTVSSSAYHSPSRRVVESVPHTG